jgi:GPH family glycoside/pentoside/hexuronide:cation symporter
MLWVPISNMKGKKVTWILGSALACTGLIVVYFAGDMSTFTRTLMFFLIGCGLHGVLVTFYAALADAADYGEWKFGTRVEAPLFGLISFANKISLGIGAWALGMGLENAGYKTGTGVTHQTPEAMQAIHFWMTIAPISGFVLSAVFIFFFPITNAMHVRIESDLNDRNSAATNA